MKQIFLLIILGSLLVITNAQQKDNEESLKIGQIPAELKAKLEISDQEKIDFKDLLKDSKVKIAKIWNNMCPSLRVIDVNDKFCVEHLNFFRGSSYTFRNEVDSYSYTNIYLVNGEFHAQESPLLQIIVDLGEIKLTTVGKDTKEFNTLIKFPMKDYYQQEKKEFISKGLDFQGIKLNDKLPAQINHTYLIRSLFPENLLREEINEFTWFMDSVIAFQIVQQKDNVITIVWKKIHSKWQ